MASEREIFHLSGPLHLICVDWDNAYHRMSVAASLVQGVYILERDRQERRLGRDALAPPWWTFFHFQLFRPLVDDDDSSIFGAIYEYKPPPASLCKDTLYRNPRYVIAFRGTLNMAGSICRDIELDIQFFRNELHRSSRSDIAIQAARERVHVVGDSNIWLAGHSLGSAMAMLAGKSSAKNDMFVDTFLFNPPFICAPIERIKDQNLKHGIRIASSLITAGLTIAMKSKQQQKDVSSDELDPFAALSSWVPSLFVNLDDHLCSEYIGYFQHRDKMEQIGAGRIERLATQNSISGLLMSALGKDSEALHLIPSAALTVNQTPSQNFRDAHGIDQWWRPHLRLEHKVYVYKNR